MWVMPSSSARCAQLPRAADKVPFYTALKRFRDYLNGVIPHIDESECVFADPKSKPCYENEPSKDNLNRFAPNSATGMGMLSGTMSDIMQHHSSDMTDISNSMMGGENDMTDIRMMDAPTKKKRGRPKKVRGEGEENIKITVPRRPQNTQQETELMGDGKSFRPINKVTFSFSYFLFCVGKKTNKNRFCFCFDGTDFIVIHFKINSTIFLNESFLQMLHRRKNVADLKR